VILLIDNYDSFTWNLVHCFARAGLDVARRLKVVRNDQITLNQAEVFDDRNPPSAIVISPGPCTPRESGVSTALIERFAGQVPILGVCLGHQAIGACHGMKVIRHSRPLHGKTSLVEHDGAGVFAGLPTPFRAARYHSLVIDAATVPDGWRVTAWTDDTDESGTKRRVVMGLRREWGTPGAAPLEGVQFHPESFMTEHGERLVRNFLDAVARRAARETLAGAGGSV
jgi:anthranilate synthase/aminodeoxychorismate synthase-like glutamine amidotransferase